MRHHARLEAARLRALWHSLRGHHVCTVVFEWYGTAEIYCCTCRKELFRVPYSDVLK